MVDKSYLPAFAVNESEKMNEFNISPMFMQQSGKKHFDKSQFDQSVPSVSNETP